MISLSFLSKMVLFLTFNFNGFEEAIDHNFVEELKKGTSIESI